jgi:hypothetical protein
VTLLLLAEVAAEALAQLQAGSQQPRFDGWDAQAECLRSLFRGEIFNIAQGKDGPEAGRETLDGLLQDLSKLGLSIILFRIGAPLGKVTRDGSVFGLDVLVHGDGLTGLALAEAHKALVDGDADQPGRELGVSLELVELLVCLEKCILRNVFSVFTVLRYVLRYAEDLALVLPDKLLEGGCVSIFGARNQRYVRMNFFRYWRLDGRHAMKVSKTRAGDYPFSRGSNMACVHSKCRCSVEQCAAGFLAGGEKSSP